MNFDDPQTKLREGNVFTPVCHFVHGVLGAGVCLCSSWDASGSGGVSLGLGCTFRSGCVPLGPGGVYLWVQDLEVSASRFGVSTTPTPISPERDTHSSQTHTDTLDKPPLETATEAGGGVLC